MYAAHEFMKVQAGLAHHRYDRVETVHQERLAAPDATPQVDAARYLGPVDQAFEGARAPRLVRHPVVIGLLQTRHRPQLRLIGPVVARGQRVLVKLLDIHRGKFDPLLARSTSKSHDAGLWR